jgi:hypothetical protein
MYLASAGYQVDVLERRGHPAEMEVDKKRTYLIGLGEVTSSTAVAVPHAHHGKAPLPASSCAGSLDPLKLLGVWSACYCQQLQGMQWSTHSPAVVDCDLMSHCCLTS